MGWVLTRGCLRGNHPLMFLFFSFSFHSPLKIKKQNLKRKNSEPEACSGQDGGIGRNPLLPCTTKSRITINLKSKNPQKCLKILLHGTPTTKELRKQSTRPTISVSWADRTCSESLERVCGVGWQKPGCCSGLCGRAWLNSKLRLTTDFGVWWGVLWWEKLEVSREGSLQSGLEPSSQSALFPRWPLPHRVEEYRQAATHGENSQQVIGCSTGAGEVVAGGAGGTTFACG